ncbi:hypothetical protein [Mycobacteroides abscessus]|uniref:hypothetical protein n=1 Tax=Mycobacteroides abscessus TaxID=36809 RepID=UPI001F43A7FF|nr:hypothetical protein [Mycobacteroides abscessus]MDO3019365.1 hypothetical protein [Mycobacteroides abscessus subsp. abscessus]
MALPEEGKQVIKELAALVLTVGVGASAVGCGQHSTITVVPISTGDTSSSAQARPLVDVSALWATKPLPPCDDYLGTDLTVPPGLSVPDHASVARSLAGVKSPGNESWVKTKLGWLDMWLAQTRAGIIDHPDSPAVKSKVETFDDYVEHVRSELGAGKNIPSDLDSLFPEACI